MSIDSYMVLIAETLAANKRKKNVRCIIINFNADYCVYTDIVSQTQAWVRILNLLHKWWLDMKMI